MIEEKKILVRVDKDMWQLLRKISFDNEVSLNKLGIEAFELLIKKYQKKS